MTLLYSVFTSHSSHRSAVRVVCSVVLIFSLVFQVYSLVVSVWRINPKDFIASYSNQRISGVFSTLDKDPIIYEGQRLGKILKMSLNTAHADHGVLIHQGEMILLFSDNVIVDFYGNETPEFKGSKVGRMYLTSHRMIYNSKNNSDQLRSFSFPFIALEDVTVEQPMFSANFIKGKVRAQPNGNFNGEVKFKLTFKSGGAIQYGQAMLQAARLASRHMHAGSAPPPYTPPTGPWHAAPPPAYAPPPQGYYGWVPPYSEFPDQPPPNSVFVTPNPPPYPGVNGATYPAGGQFSGAGSPTGANGYPGAPSAPGFAGGMPPGYPGGMSPGYPATAPPPGYPGGFAPPATAGMSSNDAKAAEAAQSAYYDPNRPQTAYVPPPYDQPPTYQESTSKKEN